MTREEAIKTIRLTCPKISDSECDFETAMRFLIPELRESEDERIRKVIYKLMLGMREEIFTSQDEIVTKEKVLAYLEKQKEQNLIVANSPQLIEQKPAWSEEDEKKIGRLRSVVNQLASYTDSLDVNGDYCAGDYAELDAWLKSLRLKHKVDDFTVEEFNAISRAIEILYGSHFAIVPPLKDILTKMAQYDK